MNNFEKTFADSARLMAYLREKLSTHQPETYRYRDIDGVDAAVLIPIFYKKNQPHLLFTKRTDQVEHHKGQISFPGGRRDEEDGDLLKTALRETEEEMGIRAEDVTVVGSTDRFLTNTHFMVTPFVGFYPYPYPYQPNEAEIDVVIEAPLIHFLQDDNFESKTLEKEGHTCNLHYYYYRDEVIWGVTGFLLSNFLFICFGKERNFF